MMRLHLPRLAAHWPAIAAGALGFLWFLQIGGGPSLDPSNVGWIPGGDWMQHWLGWLAFRREAWTIPLGTITSMPYPVGTSIGFTDSNPLVSLLLKPFSGLMPAEVQFIGPWLALCFVLQGCMGAKLASTVTADKGQQLLAGYLFVLSPVLVARIGHDTLSAHWLLLLLLYLGLREYTGPPRRAMWLAVGAVMLSAAIHPYLAATCWVLAEAVFVRMWRARLVTPRGAAAAALAATAGLLAVLGVIGYFAVGTTMASSGFGSYAADLLTLVAPEGHSHLLQHLPALALPWEGYGYLGLGGMAAVAVAIGVFLRTWRFRGYARTEGTAAARLRPGTWAIVVAACALAFYALSVEVRFNGDVIMTAKRLYSPLTALTGPFRASGRFIWPLHYLGLAFGVWGVTRVAGSERRAAGTAVLAVAVLLQATDLKVDTSWSADKHFKRAPVAAFEPARGRFDHLALSPMEVLGVCGPFEEEHAYRYMLLAQQLGLTYNSGIFARVPATRIAAECVRLQQAVEAGTFDPRTIYVVSPRSLSLFTSAGAACGRFDGDWICVSRDSDERFRTVVGTGVDPGARR